MWTLVALDDSIRLPPGQFDDDRLSALTNEIDRKYCNRVIAEVGLCIACHSIQRIGDGYVYPSDGAAHIRVWMRLLVFRPLVGEVLVGKILQQTAAGVRVSLGFSADVFVPQRLLFESTAFDPAERRWVWQFSQEEGEPLRLVFENDHTVRMRVRTIEYQKPVTTQTSAGLAAAASAAGGDAPALERQRSSSFDADEGQAGGRASMQLECSMDEDGLGVTGWWNTSQPVA